MPPARAPSQTGSPPPGSTRRSCGRRSGCGGRRSWPRSRARPRSPSSAGREEHADDRGLALRQPGRPLESRHLLPGGSRTAVTASASRRPALVSCASSSAACSGGSGSRWGRGAVIAQYASAAASSRAGSVSSAPADAAVVAGAVEALVVGSRDVGERREELRARENSLGVIGMEPHLLPLVRVQRPVLLPDPRAHRDPSEVVDERRPPERRDAGFVHPAALRRRFGQLRHGRGVTRQIRREQIREIAHRRERAIQRLPLERRAAGAARRRASRPTPRRARPRRGSPGMVGEAARRPPGRRRAPPGRGPAARRVPRLRAGVGRQRPPRAGRSASAAGSHRLSRGRAGPSRPSARTGGRRGPRTDPGRPSPSASIPATSHVAARCGRISRAILGSRRATWPARTSPRLSGSGSARMSPVRTSRPDPYRTGWNEP